jgi:hypothetical protein
MHFTIIRSGWLCSFILLILFTSNAWALRCGNALVQEKDTMDEVREACGEPTKEFQQTVSYRAEQDSFSTDRYSELTIWVYNFGRNNFVQILQFENNYLKRIDQGDYGREYAADRNECKGPIFHTRAGMWAPEVELICGEPDDKKLIEHNRRPYAGNSSLSYTKETVVEAWRYDFPDSKKTAVLKFENGRLTWTGWHDPDDLHW